MSNKSGTALAVLPNLPAGNSIWDNICGTLVEIGVKCGTETSVACVHKGQLAESCADRKETVGQK